MGKSKTTGKHRLDRFYHLAKEQGYRSRAAFKLVQLDSKYRFLSSSRALLDLCAAPGGWMQVAYKHMPVGSFIVGVDLVPIRPVRGTLTLQEDITTPKCRASIRKLMKEHGCSVFDVILHDGSPNVGGAWAKEATSQAALVLDSLKLATEFLGPKGTFVTKVFRSQDYSSLLYAFKQLFEKVEVTKPVASRATSAEIYVICLRYRAPAKIDPRLLDLKHLFQDIEEPPQVVDVLRGTKQKRHRGGYEEGNTTLRKECTASNFVWTEKPLELLGSITSISFNDPACVAIKDHPLTTDEIKLLCEDLQVLGKQEFKQLLKWRINLRKALMPVETEQAHRIGTNETSNKDEDLLNEMGELKAMIDAKTKKERKKLAKRRAKAKIRAATGMKIDVMEDGYADGGLFSLASIKGKAGLEAMESESGASSDQDESGNELIDETKQNSSPPDELEFDSDIEREKYDAELELYLDRAYKQYRKSTDGSTKRRKRAKLDSSDKDLWHENDDPDIILEEVGRTSLDGTMDAAPSNPLVIPLDEGDAPSREQIAKQWFSQDIFEGFEAMEADPGVKSPQRDERRLTKMHKVSEIEVHDRGSIHGSAKETAADDGFEVVHADTSGSDTSSDDEEDDIDSKAEILAYAKRMLHKKNREDLMDDAYNRYTFNDEGLPDWFVDDEKRHCQPIKPITKEEVEAMKAQFNAINTRPVKKVAEAKARKKQRALKKLESIKQKVNALAEQPSMSAHSKNKMIERLYKKAEIGKKPKKELVIAKKGIGTGSRKGRIVVDRRMKKDKRAHGSGKPGRKGKPVPANKQRKGRSFSHGKQRRNKSRQGGSSV
ncbi:hypothetical protein KP509_33G005200 [Ceratopteris richardii]|uniref:Putative rRNA methyltransferase n=1 Tax=Ceratopteris richardii TaxID=49495 RepID=A0A8T2QM13_CERRI|nr:hypothetical protein KP509_33G005200 [Ceratopteris richardii]